MHASSSSTALVMLDTRPLAFEQAARASVSLKVVSPSTLAAFCNMRWACLHGYDFFFFRLAGGGCTHPTWGRRHPSYCKLSAVSHVLALSKYDWVVFFDSDAFVRNSLVDLPQLLTQYGAVPRSLSAQPSTGMPSVFFAWDTPYSLGPNAGFFVARDTNCTRELLHTWWHLDHGPYGVTHSFEQNSLQWVLMHTDSHRHTVQTLRLRAIHPLVPDAIGHLDHNVGTKQRVWSMAAAAVASILGEERDRGVAKGGSTAIDIRARGSGSSGSSRGSNQNGSAANQQATLRALLGPLSTSVRGRSYSSRQKAISIVMDAIGESLRSMQYVDMPKRNPMEVDLRRHGRRRGDTNRTHKSARGQERYRRRHVDNRKRSRERYAAQDDEASTRPPARVDSVGTANSSLTSELRRLRALVKQLSAQLAISRDDDNNSNRGVHGLKASSSNLSEPWSLKLGRRLLSAAQSSSQMAEPEEVNDGPRIVARRSGGCHGSVQIIDSFNATQSAMRTIPLHHNAAQLKTRPMLTRFWHGQPLQLRNCSTLSSSWRDGATIPAPIAGWQRWRLGSHSRRLILSALRTACISLGTTRTHKKPHAALAVVSPCRGAQGSSAARMSSNVTFSSVSVASPFVGEIRTGHTLAELREHIPSFHRGCGFWPNCTGVHTVLPKPCWDDLAGGNVSACGSEEPALLYTARRRAGRAGRMQIALGPGGPATVASLNTGANLQLCLAPWRGRLFDGAPVVFARCPGGDGTPKGSEMGATTTHTRSLGRRLKGTGKRASSRMRRPQGTPGEARIRSVAHSSSAHTTPGREDPRAARQNAVWSFSSLEDAATVKMKHGGLRISPMAAPHLCLTVPPLIPLT